LLKIAIMSVSVILIEPKDSINIGSVARVMDNLSFTDLTLVTPRQYDREQAQRSACWATPVLDRARFCHQFDEAVQGSELVVGFSSRHSGAIQHARSLESWCEYVKTLQPQPHNISFVFGPEESGLSNDLLLRCHDIVYIETSDANPSMNLSHAVAVALYRARSLLNLPVVEVIEDEQYAEFEQYKSLELLIEKSLEHTGFFHEHTPSDIPKLVFNVCKRAKLSRREMAVMQGIFGSIKRSSC
jgi:TrmH family RNA methyltransferase